MTKILLSAGIRLVEGFELKWTNLLEIDIHP